MKRILPPAPPYRGVDAEARPEKLTDLPTEIQCAIARHVLNGPAPRDASANLAALYDETVYDLAVSQGLI